MTMNKFAIISCDSNPIYSFYLPIVCEAWRQLGFQPYVLASVGEGWKDPAPALAYQETAARTGNILRVPTVPGFRQSTVMQTVRLTAAWDPFFAPDAYLVTTDVDMLPLSAALFEHASPSALVHVYSADAYRPLEEGLPVKFPMCYLGASALVWRAMLAGALPAVEMTERGPAVGMLGEPKGPCDGVARALYGREDSWNNDEDYFRVMLNGFLGGPPDRMSMARGAYRSGCVELIERGGWPNGGMARGRLDREAWSWGDGEFLDCHGPRPGWNDALLERVVTKYLPADVAAGLLRYKKAFARLAG